MATKYTYQESKGLWQTRVWDGTYTKDGQKHYKTLSSRKSSKDLENKVAEFKKAVELHEVTVKNNILFIDYCYKWLERDKSGLRINTKEKYRQLINCKFTKLKGIRMTDLNKDHWYILADQETPSSQEEIMKIYRQVVNCAVRDKLLPISAVNDLITSITLPKKKKPVKRALKQSEIDAVKNIKLKDKHKAFLWIIYGCGLRRSEALALQKTDIVDGKINIDKDIAFKNQHLPVIEGIPKTENSYREVPIPDFAKDFITNYAKSVDNYLFTNTDGSLITLTGYKRMWEQITKTIYAEIGEDTHLTAHIFRHNYASRLMSQVPEHISFSTACAMVGDSPKTLMSVYMHSIQDKENKNQAINNVF